MAMSVIPLEQRLDRQLLIFVIEATTWWETVLAHVKLQECGLGVNLPVNVCCYQPACVHVHMYASIGVHLPGNLMEDNMHILCQDSSQLSLILYRT